MKLKDVLRYYEINGTDFLTDLQDFAQLQKEFYNDIVEDNFMERYELFTERLLELWISNQGGWRTFLESNSEPPSYDELVEMYCKNIEQVETKGKQEDLTMFFSDSSLRKKKKEDNKTLQLMATLANIGVDATQFMELELEVVYSIIEILGKKKEEEERKRKQRRKGR